MFAQPAVEPVTETETEEHEAVLPGDGKFAEPQLVPVHGAELPPCISHITKKTMQRCRIALENFLVLR